MSDEPVIISDEMVADLDRERAVARDDAARDRRWAQAKVREAAAAEARAKELDVVREWVTARIGMPLDEAIAEAKAALQEAAAAEEAARVEAQEAREWYRDLIGHERVLRRRIADLEAQEAVPCTLNSRRGVPQDPEHVDCWVTPQGKHFRKDEP